MKILIEVRHPAHVHHFRPFASAMRDRGHEVLLLAVEKDIVLDLLNELGLAYRRIGRNRRGLARKIPGLLRQTRVISRICSDFQPDVIVGRPSVALAAVGRRRGIPTLIFAEDDLSVAPLAGLTAFPFADHVITPSVTQVGPFAYKQIRYRGYQKLAYLHPNVFEPDPEVGDRLKGDYGRFYLIRVAALVAHHDRKGTGLGDDLLRRLVLELSQSGEVYISAERPIPEELESRRFPLAKASIHDALHHAALFVGDSQSMTVEAAILGTPSVRYSRFTGRISVLEELEHEYGLTAGVQVGDREGLFRAVERMLNEGDQPDVFETRKRRLIAEKVDVTAFMVWFVENYPNSLSDPAMSKMAGARPSEGA